MEQRTLARGERLWAQGEPALLMGVVDKGKLAVRTPDRVLGVVFPGMVLGESAIFALDGPAVTRSASVVALEDGTQVTQYSPALIRESFGAGVPRLVLRTLCGQICRNALLTVAAAGQPSNQPLLSLIQGVVQSERDARGISTWPEFLVAFRILYHLREGSDAMRNQFIGHGGEVSATILEASKTARELFKAQDTIAYLEAFLETERARHAAGAA